MKSIISKLVAVLLLSTQGAFTLQGMAIDANDYLGNIPAPGVISLDQKLALEDKKERTKKQRYGLAAKEVVASCLKWSNSNLVSDQLASDQNHPIHQPHKKVRSLSDVYILGKMPAEVWKSHCVQLIDYGPSLFPVTMKPTTEGSCRGFLSMLPGRSSGLLKGRAGSQIIIDLDKNCKSLYTAPSVKFQAFSFDYTKYAAYDGQSINIIDVSSGKIVRNIPCPGARLENIYFSNTGNFFNWRTFNGDFRCFDLTIEDSDGWQIPNTLSYGISDRADNVLAFATRDQRIIVYDMKTKNICFEAAGSEFRLNPDGSRIAVEHNNRIKIFDLTTKEHKELFDRAGRDLINFIGTNNIGFRDIDSPKTRIYDIQSSEQLFEISAVMLTVCDSPDGKFIVDYPYIPERGTFTRIYDLASRTMIFQEACPNMGGAQFSNDSHYFIFENSKGASTLVDLASQKTWQLPGINPVLSSDSRFCASAKMHKTIKKSFMGDEVEYSIETVIIDLRTKKEIARYMTEAVPGFASGVESYFSADNNALYVHASFTQYGPGNWISTMGPAESYNKIWKFDVSPLKDKNFQNVWANTLTQHQSTLLMLLDEVKEKNNGAPISLLHDIALKKMLSLRELQATLASFHPLIRDSIIQRYAIIDPTPESMKKATQQKVDENKKLWMNVAKITGVSTLVAALGAWWYLKKK